MLRLSSPLPVLILWSHQLPLRRYPIPIVVVGRGIDVDGVITRASINGGIECTECADIALPGSIGIDVEAIVTAA